MYTIPHKSHRIIIVSGKHIEMLDGSCIVFVRWSLGRNVQEYRMQSRLWVLSGLLRLQKKTTITLIIYYRLCITILNSLLYEIY